MLLKNIMLLLKNSLPTFKCAIISAAGMQFKFKPPFILVIDRIPKLFRVGRVDQYGYTQLTTLRPHRIDTRIINCNSFAALVFGVNSKGLINLQTFCTTLHILF